jgi:hypothetical protein
MLLGCRRAWQPLQPPPQRPLTRACHPVRCQTTNAIHHSMSFPIKDIGLLPLSLVGAADACTAAVSTTGARVDGRGGSSASVMTPDGTVLLDGLGPGIAANASVYVDRCAEGQSDHAAAISSAAAAGMLLLDLSLPESGPAVPATALPLGNLHGNAFVASARTKLCWMAPAHAPSPALLPRHVQFLLVRLDNSSSGSSASTQGARVGPAVLYAVLLPLLPAGFHATLQPAP